MLKAKVKYWSGDQMAYVDELTRLIMRCKVMSRKACTGLTVKVGTTGVGASAGEGKGKKVKARDEVAIDMWKERGTRVCLILASQLIEMKVTLTPQLPSIRPLILTSSLSLFMSFKWIGLCSSDDPPHPSTLSTQRNTPFPQPRLVHR